MNRLGLGGKTVKLFSSFYENDYIRIEIGNEKSKKMYLKNGLRQGCSISPAAFNIAVRDIAEDSMNWDTGIPCGSWTVNALFYADDILLLATNEKLARESLAKLKSKCEKIGLNISMEKSKIVGMVEKKKSEGDGGDDLDTVLNQRYLGVEQNLRSNRAFLDSRVSMARKYANSCKALASTSPDPVLFVHTIWFMVALPGILYGTECILLSEDDVKKIESIQSNLAKFALQIHANSANIIAQLLGGFRPFFAIYWERILKYYTTMKKYDDFHWGKKALNENIRMGESSEYLDRVGKIWTTIGWDGEEKSIRGCIDTYTSRHINEERVKCYKTCRLLTKSTVEKVTNTSRMKFFGEKRKTYHEFITYDAGLGNRHPLPGEDTIKLCPLCLNDGKLVSLEEEHVLLECEALEQIRIRNGIRNMITRWEKEGNSENDNYKKFWMEANLDDKELTRRIHLAKEIRDIYLEATTIISR